MPMTGKPQAGVPRYRLPKRATLICLAVNVRKARNEENRGRGRQNATLGYTVLSRDRALVHSFGRSTSLTCLSVVHAVNHCRSVSQSSLYSSWQSVRYVDYAVTTDCFTT